MLPYLQRLMTHFYVNKLYWLACSANKKIKKISKYFGKFLIKHIQTQTTKLTRNFILQAGCTDTASCNFIGLVKIYGEGVLQYIKGCKFHFRDSLNQYANKFGDESETFKKYALQHLQFLKHTKFPVCS